MIESEFPTPTGDPEALLTPTERQVLALLRKGERNPDIAAALGVTVSTSETYVRAVIRKLGLTSRWDLLPPRPTIAPDIQLTAREAEALALLKSGLTDREIGEHFGISRRAAVHVTQRLRAKLGVAHRDQLRASSLLSPGASKPPVIDAD